MAESRDMPRLVIAGTGSGAGKTTVTIGLCAAFRARGLEVAPFKVGPDYIDPAYTSAVCGRGARCLDAWMLGADGLRDAFLRGAQGADVSVVEGMMGLFDGFAPDADAGSTAEAAALLGAPVVLVVDAAGMARSAAAVVAGFAGFAPGLRLAGVIANRVGGPGHLELLRAAIEGSCGVPVLGGLPAEAAGAIPERHLGLTPAAENPRLADIAALLGRRVREHCDVPGLLELARTAPPLAPEPGPPARPGAAVRLGYARDAAFHFYYEDNLDLLRAAGAELVAFSPLADAALPPGCAGLYVGGGFPEVRAAELARNGALHAAVRGAAAAGMPIVAECGGLMWLSAFIEDGDGARHGQVGLLPVGVRMTGRLAGFGYRTVEAVADSPLLPVGATARGHEFRYSELATPLPPGAAAFRARGRTGAAASEGYRAGALLASYVHLHWGSCPGAAQRFVAAAARFAATRAADPAGGPA